MLRSPSMVKNSGAQRDHSGTQRSGHYKLEEELRQEDRCITKNSIWSTKEEQKLRVDKTWIEENRKIIPTKES